MGSCITTLDILRLENNPYEVSVSSVAFSNILYSGLAVKHELLNDRFLETLMHKRAIWENETNLQNCQKHGTRKKPQEKQIHQSSLDIVARARR